MQLHQMVAALLLACALVLVDTASVGVVRVPRVYNILIRSDGALAPSEAVSADSVRAQPAGDDSPSEDDGAEEQEEDGENAGEEDMEELPVLDPKAGAIKEGVNYTAVPLSRAYPLTRYTAPLLAAHYPLGYLAPLHGGLILGPAPRLPPGLQEQQQQFQQQFQQPQQQFQQAPREPRPELRTSPSLPRGAFEDPERESVGVEAEEEA